MIDRLEATRLVVEMVHDAPIVASLGNATFDLSAFDRPANFYIWNSMGMASSVGLGLAIAQPDRRIVILDGDGSLLMNLGSLATAVTAGAKNLIHVVWDNGAWDITGGQPVGRPFGVNLEAVARGCGFAQTAAVADMASFRAAFESALADTDRWFILVVVKPGGSSHRPSKNMMWVRDRFTAALRDH